MSLGEGGNLFSDVEQLGVEFGLEVFGHGQKSTARGQPLRRDGPVQGDLLRFADVPIDYGARGPGARGEPSPPGQGRRKTAQGDRPDPNPAARIGSVNTEESLDWIATSEALPDSGQPVRFQVDKRTLTGLFSDGSFKEETGGRFAPDRVERWQPTMVIPHVLYKYRDLYPENREWVRQIIVENKIKFSSPGAFNDPFDCKVRAPPSAGAQRWKRFLGEQFRKAGLSRKQQQAEVRRILKVERRHEDPGLGAAIAVDVQRQVNSIGVLCLSTRNDDLLMWSYYAGGHGGVCLGFLHRPNAFGLPCAFPVKYPEEYPEVNLFDPDKRRSVDSTLLTKAAAWKHESEWRFIDYRGTHGVRVFAPDLLTEIILGAKISATDRDAVIGWVEQSPCRPALYEARLKEREYGLDIVPITGG